MRVLFFIAYPQRLAGTNRVLFELVTRLPRRLEPVVVTVGEGRVGRAYREAGVPTHVLTPGPSLMRYGKAMFGWSAATRVRVALRELLPYQLRLARLLRRERIDVVHVNDPRGSLLVGGAARATGRRLVGHLHGDIGVYGGVARRVFEASATTIVTVCSAIQAGLGASARRKATTVYVGIDDVATPGEGVPHLERLRRDGVLVVGCVGSVAPFKGQHHLIEAVAALSRRGWARRLHVVCVGEPMPEYRPYFEALQRRAEGLGVRNVEFAGWQDAPHAYYRSMDAAVLPSVAVETLTLEGMAREVRGGEGVPVAHLEAMCFGLPVIGTDVAGVRELIHDGAHGLVVPPSDSAALAGALERLLSDAEARARWGAAGRARVLEHFSTPAFVRGMSAVYDAVGG